MLAAPGVSCVCSDVSRSKSDRVRVENALCRLIRVTAHGADDVRTVFWRTTGMAPASSAITPDAWPAFSIRSAWRLSFWIVCAVSATHPDFLVTQGFLANLAVSRPEEPGARAAPCLPSGPPAKGADDETLSVKRIGLHFHHTREAFP